MPRVPQQQTHAHGWPLLGILAAVLLGVLAMHGVSPHAATHAASSIGVSDVGASAAHGHASAADHSGSPSDGSSDEHHGSATEMCLALLGMLFALALAVAWRARPVRPLVLFRRRRTRLVRAGRPPDPPCLMRLSILRC